ncbi:F-box domain-containing protein [Mycena indigotica]|uniref:F-box domain-containing protein n=1 Tax=Mycena indigotica TaxID=2126181 RepID=A0A8H6SB28_9AGAR|nr:F-box domain-containing protein [Mycena indigotica]KAF7295687.1 F-box domain-containing protein [Mycena indigotica]
MPPTLPPISAAKTRLAPLDAEPDGAGRKSLLQLIRGFNMFSVLPDEMVLAIFAQYHPRYPDCAPQKGDGSPIQLMLVCRRWRDLVINTSNFWRGLWINEEWSRYRVPTESAREEQDKIDLWLSRAKDHLLSVRLTSEPSARGHNYIVEALSRSRERWEYAELVIWGESDLPLLIGPAPHLRELALDIAGEVPVDGTPFFAYDMTPVLERVVVCLSSPGFSLTLSTDNFVLSQTRWRELPSVTFIRDQMAQIRPFLTSLCAFDSLVHCRMVGSGPFHGYENLNVEEPTKVCHRLQSLILQGHSLGQGFREEREPTMTGYLETFVTPSLLRLQVPEPFLLPDPVETIRRFIGKSKCTLRELCITSSSAEPVEATLRNYLTAFPSIPSIVVKEEDDTWQDPQHYIPGPGLLEGGVVY